MGRHSVFKTPTTPDTARKVRTPRVKRNKSNFSDGGSFFGIFAAVVVVLFGLLYMYAGSVTGG